MFDRLEAGFDSITKSVESKTLSNAEFQKVSQEQMQHLRADVMRYEEITIDNRKTHESNAALKEQLDLQQRHSSQLEAQIQTLQQSEVDLKARSNQLERELVDLRQTRNPQSYVSELEQGAVDLHEQLKKSEEHLEAATATIEKGEQLRQYLEQDRARYKVSFMSTMSNVRFLTYDRYASRTPKHTYRR